MDPFASYDWRTSRNRGWTTATLTSAEEAALPPAIAAENRSARAS